MPAPLWRDRAGAIKHLQPADGAGGEREDPGLQFGCQKGRLAREHATALNSARQQHPDPLADGLRLNERRPSLHVRPFIRVFYPRRTPGPSVGRPCSQCSLLTAGHHLATLVKQVS